MDESIDTSYDRAVAALGDARALLITAGAGIGVDSGLPDFRGNQGFWKAYPPFARLGLSFIDMANPSWFATDPELAWGFYGHRMKLYRSTVPHPGFDLLKSWGDQLPDGCFVFTSNVDGQFQRAGFARDQIVECHGSIHHLQCSRPCSPDIWPADEADVEIDEETMRASPPLPECPACGAVARPNILMFGDWGWHGSRTSRQEQRLSAWLRTAGNQALMVVELGAGSAVPTVRMTSERTVSVTGGTLVRINPREPQVPRQQIGIAAPALQALQAIQDRRIQQNGDNHE
jgi:NAD-dependent SIR2 family protein deacetylase